LGQSSRNYINVKSKQETQPYRWRTALYA